MSLDTKYRPRQYFDVVGQGPTVEILRHFVDKNRGFQQSYLFAGPKGCGKTTLGRILSRALLCDAPIEGNPCDLCESCLNMLSDPPVHECFTEMDAATNSGKEQIQDIVDTQKYETFSGRQRVYLIDECHRLTAQAMDGLLKSLEDTVPGTEDRVLVCIFCTTEPEKVRGTISSRCAPTFVIHKADPEKIADRCAEICDLQEITYEKEALVLIAEAVECHIRDALQAVSGVSVLGDISLENVRNYLRLDASKCYLQILGNLGRDLRAVVEAVDELEALVSPSTCYAKLSDIAMQVFKSVSVKIGKLPKYWSLELLIPFEGARLRNLVDISHWLSQRPGRASQAMLLCDLTTLHHRIAEGVSLTFKESFVVVKEVSAASSVSESVTKPVTASIAKPVVEAKDEEDQSLPVKEEKLAPIPHEIQSGPVKILPDGSVSSLPEISNVHFGVHIDPNYQPKKKVDKEPNADDYSIDTARKILFDRVGVLSARRSSR